jgi:hypothetical protein
MSGWTAFALRGKEMGLQDPVAIYNAADNFEAQLICNLLNDAGIEAYLTEDVSPVGVWLFGLLPEIHKPQVWTERANMERVKPLLDEYERQQVQRQQAEAKRITEGATVEASCEECGHQSVFSIALEGTVQDCPHCGAYMDVGEPPHWDESREEAGSGENSEENS